MTLVLAQHFCLIDEALRTGVGRTQTNAFHFTIFFFKSIVLPSTTNVPSPFAWNVRRSLRCGSLQAFIPSKMKMFYLVRRCVGGSIAMFPISRYWQRD